MPHDSNGRIYISNGQGIDVRGDVAYVLGRSTGDVGQLCGDVKWDRIRGAWVGANAIKKWSKYKPVRHTSKGVSSQAEVLAIMKEANYGFGGLDMFSNVDDEAVFNLYISKNGDWEYFPPDGLANNHPYRILDFWGYDHQANLAPISIQSGVLQPSGQYTSNRIYFTFTIQTAAQIGLLDFSLADWSSYDSTSADNNYKYAVMIRKRGESGSPTIHYGINVFKLENGQIVYNHKPSEGPNEELIFDAPTEEGVYEMVPCIIRHSPSQSASIHGNCIYLPAGQLFTYNGTPYTTAYCDQFQIVSKTLGSHRPTAQELASGNGYLDITLNISVRVLRNSHGNEGCQIKYVTRIGTYTRNASSDFIETYGDTLPKVYTYTKTRTQSQDNPLMLPTVPLDYGQVVQIWLDFYDYGDNLLGSELLTTIV